MSNPYGPPVAVAWKVPRNPAVYVRNRVPNANDRFNYNIGDFWLYKMPNPDQDQNHIYVLVALADLTATWVFLGTSPGSPATFTGNTGAAVYASATTPPNLFIIGDGATITISGNPADSTLTASLIAPVTVPNGGTGDTSFTAYAPLCGGTTTTGPLQSASTGISTSGFILTSTGASSLPSFQAPAASSISITGNTGGALTGSSFTFTGGTTGLSFGGAGSTETLTFAGITANGGTVSLATDATASTINIGTGGGAKTTTLGSTNTTSTTTIQSGSGNIIHNTGFTVDSTGRNYNTKQPAFFAYQASSTTNATGDGTSWQMGTSAMTEKFDQGNYFNTNGTFTAPIAGIYLFGAYATVSNLSSGHTDFEVQITASGTTYNGQGINAFVAQSGVYSSITEGTTCLVSMAASDTAVAKVNVANSTKTVTVFGSSSPNTYFYGYLVC